MIEHCFATRDQASIEAAGRISAAIARRTSAQDRVAVVVSGGSTPTRCFVELAATEIDWAQIDVYLSDERWVPADHHCSNEKLVNENLLSACAREATLHGAYREGLPIRQRCSEIDADLRQLSFPFASVLLGMGTDGHFASLFPDLDELTAATKLDGETLCIPVFTDASSYPRISLTLSALCRSDEIILLIFGDEKWQTLDRARRSDDACPVSRLLLQDLTPVHVFWAP